MEKWLDRLTKYFVAPMIFIFFLLLVVLPLALQLFGIARFDQ